MNNYYYTISLLTCFLSSLTIVSYGQTVNRFHDTKEVKKSNLTYYYVKTKDNTKFTGAIIDRNREEAELTFQLYDYYNVVILRNNIKSMRRIKSTEVVDGEYVYPDPNQSRYFTQPTGIGMKAGQLQYKTTNLLYQSLHYGLSDNVALHAGGEFYTTLVQKQPSYHLGTTLTFPVYKNLYVGGNISFSSIADKFEKMATGQAFLTFGNTHTNISAGYGYGYPTTNTSFEDATQFATANFKYRFNRRFAIVSENWYFINANDDEILETTFSLGARFMLDHLALDLAVVHNKNFREKFIIGLPLINFTYTFQ